MILSTKGRYAVMALVDIAVHGNNGPVKLASISQRQELDQGYLEQIFVKLKKVGLVIPIKGPGGGYLLGKPKSEIAISDIMFAVEENLRMTRCHKASSTGCMQDKTQCVTHHIWEALGDHIQNFLNGITLEDVCAKRLARVDSCSFQKVVNAS